MKLIFQPWTSSWLSLDPLWLSEWPDIPERSQLLKVSQGLSVFPRQGRQFAPSFRLFGSLALKVSKRIQFHLGGFPGGSDGKKRKKKNLPTMQETWVWSLGRVDPLETGMATHSSILAWRIPWTEEPGGLQFAVHRFTKSRTRLRD